jgi:hypothetical protein
MAWFLFAKGFDALKKTVEKKFWLGVKEVSE